MDKDNRMKEYNRDAYELMDRFFSHQASDDEIRALEQWVMMSDDNRAAYLRRRAAAQVIDATITPGDIDSEKALRRIAPARPAAYAGRMTTRLLAVAASLLLIVSVTLGILLHNSHQEHRANVAQVIMEAPFGSMVQTTLPDGSAVWLNANSSLTYPAEFLDNARPVSLKGEAFFKVSADKRHPFVVNTDRTSIIATGTQFNVNAYREPAVTLVDGKVDVRLKASDRQIKLAPGDHLCIKGNRVDITHNANLRKWCGWRDGILLFDNDPLADVFERLGQIYNIAFSLKDETIGQSRCHATFTGENISDILHLLELSAPIKFVCTSADNDSVMSVNVIAKK